MRWWAGKWGVHEQQKERWDFKPRLWVRKIHSISISHTLSHTGCTFQKSQKMMEVPIVCSWNVLKCSSAITKAPEHSHTSLAPRWFLQSLLWCTSCCTHKFSVKLPSNPASPPAEAREARSGVFYYYFRIFCSLWNQTCPRVYLRSRLEGTRRTLTRALCFLV